MAELKPGKSSTELWTLIGAALVAVAQAGGIVPEGSTIVDLTNAGKEVLPLIIGSVVNLASQHSASLLVVGLAYAYLKRRTALKGKALK